MSDHELFNKNLSFFSPAFREKLLAFSNASHYDFSVETSKNNYPVPKYRNKYLHSKYDPLIEAQRFSEQTTGNYSQLVIFGFAFGYHVEELLNKFPTAKIVVIEFTPVLFVEALKRRDFSKLLKTGRVEFIVEEELNSFLEQFKALDNQIKNESGCHVVIYPPSMDSVSVEFKKVIDALQLIEMGRRQPRV
ncbi:MAG: motility associated factor glycosyltransferase family protein, partial [Nitrospinae bacterium]|nr:motility associated factor glycosyltransferase family protein [Nitrospinota bacterium]